MRLVYTQQDIPRLAGPLRAAAMISQGVAGGPTMGSARNVLASLKVFLNAATSFERVERCGPLSSPYLLTKAQISSR